MFKVTYSWPRVRNLFSVIYENEPDTSPTLDSLSVCVKFSDSDCVLDFLLFSEDEELELLDDFAEWDLLASLERCVISEMSLF